MVLVCSTDFDVVLLLTVLFPIFVGISVTEDDESIVVVDNVHIDVVLSVDVQFP